MVRAHAMTFSSNLFTVFKLLTIREQFPRNATHAFSLSLFTLRMLHGSRTLPRHFPILEQPPIRDSIVKRQIASLDDNFSLFSTCSNGVYATNRKFQTFVLKPRITKVIKPRIYVTNFRARVYIYIYIHIYIYVQLRENWGEDL